MTDLVELQQITKSFGRARALDGLNLTISAGEVHGLLGPNGAGKSTTIRVLLGMLHADTGTARVLGHDPWTSAPEVRGRLAYVPGDVSLWPNLTGGEVIDLLARMHGGEDRARRDALIERFELDPTKRSRTYSKGNRQKVGLVSALSVTAELLILDEPTSGLDPLMEEVFKQCVSEARDAGCTVLLSGRTSSPRSSSSVTGSASSVPGRSWTPAAWLTCEGTPQRWSPRLSPGTPPGLDTLPGIAKVTVDGNRAGADHDPVR